MNIDELVDRAKEFAKEAHKDQVRKYTGEPYFVHCEAVAKILQENDIYPEHFKIEEVIAAAYLHDTVEDCDTTIEDIEKEFGKKVAILVDELTNKSQEKDGNRAARKKIDRDRLKNASNAAKTIKLADLISNTSSIAEHDKKFAKVYLREKELLLTEALSGGASDLFARAEDQLNKSLEILNKS